jgi:arylsulfatase B
VPPPELHTNRKLDERSPDADKYDAALEAVDHELGRVLAAMDPALRARTWVFVVGDNGTPDFAIRPPDDPERAKGSVYQLGVNVPLIVTGPGIDHRGAESLALVHTADLFATVLDLAGVEPEGAIDGISFRSALEDPQAPSARRFLFTERLVPNGPPPYDREQAAIRDQRYTLVTDRRRSGATAELYDLRDDPDQHRDLLGRKRALDPEVQAAYDALLAELDRARGP